jgi:hypothetical protein
MADNLFADLVPAPKTPGVIYGPPKKPEPKRGSLPQGWEFDPGGNPRPIPGLPKEFTDPKGSADTKPQESERTAAFLTTNLLGAVNQLVSTTKRAPSAAVPTWGQHVAGFFGDTARGLANSPERRQVEAAQRLILDNALTLGTGAAYNKEQLEGYREAFFPSVTDDPATIASKGQALRNLLMAAKIKSGNQAPQVDAAMAALGLSNDPMAAGPRDTTPRAQGAESPPELGEMSDEQKRAYAAFWKANPNPSPRQLSTFLEGIGAVAPGEDLGNAKKIIDAVKKGQGYSTAIDRRAVLEEEIEKTGSDTPTEILLRQGATLGLSDEAAGIGRGLSKAFTLQNPIEGYRLGRDAERLRIADARDQLGGWGTGLEVAGGFLSANPQAALAPFVTRSSLIAGGARSGATGGALAGFGYGEGLKDSIEKAAVGGVAGVALGASTSAASSRYMPRGMDPDLAAAAAAEDVRISQPMLEGNRRAINRAGVLEANPLTAPTVQQGFADTAEDIGTGVARLGTGGTPETAGTAVQDAGRRFIQRSRGVASQLYNRAARLAGPATVDATRARAALDTELADLRQAPEINRAEIGFLEGLRSDLDGPLTVDAIRAIRTGLRGSINQQGLTASQAEARAMRVLNAARDDIEASVSPEAARAYRRADRFYAERQEHISDVVQRFLGRRNQPMGAEAAFTRLKGMISPNGDGRRLAAIMRNLDRDERAEVASTIASTLGRRGPEEPFSVDLLVTHASNFSPSARRVIFGPDGAQSLNNLVTLSRRLQQAQSQVNRSRTARPLLSQMGGRAKTFVASLLGLGGYGAAGIGGGIGAVAAGAGVAALNAGRQVLSARALMSPRVTRWLAEAADVNTPAQAQQAVRRLGTVISREPALAGELQPLHRRLSEAFTPPVAASGPEADANDDD